MTSARAPRTKGLIKHHSSSPRGPRPRPNDTPPHQTSSDTLTHRLCRPLSSLPMTDAQPEQVTVWLQGHWKIENRLHWARDVVTCEDHHQLHTANGPRDHARPA
ncbi:transposase [Actinomyces johnsonii]|uniref:transposase n=1 Tax=Actinomyces johnsonii TaxID=544581 RepID=UPI002F4166FE